MKRISAASSAVAAATLVSTVALAGASGAVASEPVRLSTAQMDTVAAGTAMKNQSQSVQSTVTRGKGKTHIFQSTTTIEDGKSVTRKKITTIENGKETVKEEVIKKPVGAKPSVAEPKPPKEIVDARKKIAELRSAINARVAALRGKLVEVKKPSGKHWF